MINYESVMAGVAGGLFDLVSVADNAVSVVFRLESENDGVVEISFSSPPMYSVMNESFGLVTINESLESCGDGTLIYRVTGSSFLDFFYSQSHDMYRDGNIEHYVIMCMDDIVHIFADEPPVIKRLPT